MHRSASYPLGDTTMTKRFSIGLFTACVALLLGLGVQGCSKRSGRGVPLGDPSANLQITNNSGNTLVVYVDRVELGSVQPGQTRAWDVLNGLRPVHMREVGESTLTYYGDFNFFSGNLVQLDYAPGFTHNFTVFNDSARTLDVFVDLVEIGSIPPLERGDFLVTPGIRDVHFRERGDSIDFVGTFDFPSLSNGQELVLVYRP